MDIVERLRNMQDKEYRRDWSGWVQKQCTEAANEIEKLRAERTRTQKALHILNSAKCTTNQSALFDLIVSAAGEISCRECHGTGERDSGGVYPNGDGIIITCGCVPNDVIQGPRSGPAGMEG